MENLIFIDSNIYLRFYDNSGNNYPKLLKSLVELSENIISTDQILDEVNRNKMTVFNSCFCDYKKLIKIKLKQFPSQTYHVQPAMDAFNKNIDKINELLKVQQSNIDTYFEETMHLISEGKDNISIELAKIFKNRKTPNATTIEKARIRKERGNPPGKKEDPLGDQINWEILLENIKDCNKLFFITNDKDYVVKSNSTTFLNPKLYDEITHINPNIKIFCFDELSIALSDLKNRKLKYFVSFPTDEELQNIIVEESIKKDYCNCVNPIIQGTCSNYCRCCNGITSFQIELCTNPDGSNFTIYKCCSCSTLLN